VLFTKERTVGVNIFGSALLSIVSGVKGLEIISVGLCDNPVHPDPQEIKDVEGVSDSME
jgi:hypothetical protein